MGLAPMLVAEIFEIVGRLNREEGLSVLLAEQNAAMALRVAQHVYVMENGRDRARRRPRDHRRERGHQGVLPGALRRRAAQELSRREALPAPQAVAVVTGVNGALSDHQIRTRPGEPMSSQLEISDVSKAFGGVQAVTRVSVDVRKGEILSVIGPNGAGKTTLLNMISGFYHPDTGRIVLEAQGHHPAQAQQDRRAGCGAHLPEHRPVPGDDGPRQSHARPARPHAVGGVRARSSTGGSPRRRRSPTGGGSRTSSTSSRSRT